MIERQNGIKLNEINEEETKDLIAKKMYDEIFSWECVSLVRRNNTTLDFVIREPTHLMAFMNVACTQLQK